MDIVSQGLGRDEKRWVLLAVPQN